jgi:phage terminase large subunit-like protein
MSAWKVSGLLNVLAPSELRGGTISTAWNRGEGQLVLANGSRVKIYSSETPERLRGPQYTLGWGEEASSWSNPVTTYDMLMFGLRLPSSWGPRLIVTSTPKANILTRMLLRDPLTYVTNASTYDNIANLDEAFIKRVVRKYEGTRLGLQELHGQLLDDVTGALWRSEWFTYAESLATFAAAHGGIERTCVGWDVAVRSKDNSDLHGVVAAAVMGDGTYLVLADRSQRGTPVACAKVAIVLAIEFRAKTIVVEDNQGGDTWQSVHHEALTELGYTPSSGGVPRLDQRHATQSKEVRAQPAALLYEQQYTLRSAALSELGINDIQARDIADSLATLDGMVRVAHLPGLELLEKEMTTWNPESPKGRRNPGEDRDDPDWESPSPNRLDALVWALRGLGVGPAPKIQPQRRAGRLAELTR